MEQLLTDNPAMRRTLAALLTPAVAVLNRKFALGLEVADLVTIGTVMATYIATSNWKAAALAKADAAGTAAAQQVLTLDDARKLLRENATTTP